MPDTTTSIRHDPSASTESFREDVLSGLRGSPRSLPCKHFYDQRGSALFERICKLDEYYLTRTELAIMRRYAPEMGAQIGEGVMLVEYGSGSSIKTRLLLDELINPVAYAPVDISRDHLAMVARILRRDYPSIEILPVAADFTSEFRLPEPKRDYTHAAVFFPGSTIGNFEPRDAQLLLANIARLCGEGGGLLIGIDLDKDPRILELAYDDPAGITAQFNLNLLHRIRNELDADVDIEGFKHVACYNQTRSRMEIFLQSLCDQQIVIDGESFKFTPGEMIHTEYSHKYTIEGFAEIAAAAGLTLRKSWTDEKGYFAVLHFAMLQQV